MPDSIAHYRIGAKLGQGGMGEVYRATDTKLGRDVAIKVIAPALAQDPSRMGSFTREAQVLASLNHPNIAAIYGVESGPAEAGHYVLRGSRAGEPLARFLLRLSRFRLAALRRSARRH